MSDVAAVRRFNRAVTARTGALDASFLGLGRPLGVARVLWAVTEAGTEVAAIRDQLRLDSGLTSRMLRGLEREGLVVTGPAADDGRRRIVTLTEQGIAEKAKYDALNNELAELMLRTAPKQRERLVAAMETVTACLMADQLTFVEVDPDSAAARHCLDHYLALLTERIEDLPATHVPHPDPHAADFRFPNGVFLVARVDDAVVAGGALKTWGPDEGEIKRVWVDPTYRGLGVARRLMGELEERARTLGQQRLRLDTNAALREAIALYESSGWHPIAAYTGWPATHWYAKELG